MVLKQKPFGTASGILTQTAWLYQTGRKQSAFGTRSST